MIFHKAHPSSDATSEQVEAMISRYLVPNLDVNDFQNGITTPHPAAKRNRIITTIRSTGILIRVAVLRSLRISRG